MKPSHLTVTLPEGTVPRTAGTAKNRKAISMNRSEVGQASSLSIGADVLDNSPDRQDACPTTKDDSRFRGSKRELSVGDWWTEINHYHDGY